MKEQRHSTFAVMGAKRKPQSDVGLLHWVIRDRVAQVASPVTVRYPSSKLRSAHDLERQQGLRPTCSKLEIGSLWMILRPNEHFA